MTETNHTPQHIGIILDGNRRWAKEHGLPTMEGHRKGYENLKTIAREAFNSGVSYVSAFVFSTENWKRSKEEVDYLMKLLLWVAKTEVKTLDKENIRVRFAGSRQRLSQKILDATDSAEKKTANNDGGTLLICLNYGGQQEIVNAVNQIMENNPTQKKVTEKDIEQNLYAPSVPDIDLLIRTSGEQRISNFMLWRVAYSELYFTDSYWPAFTVQNLNEAIEEYKKRQRRFGS